MEKMSAFPELPTYTSAADSPGTRLRRQILQEILIDGPARKSVNETQPEYQKWAETTRHRRKLQVDEILGMEYGEYYLLRQQTHHGAASGIIFDTTQESKVLGYFRAKLHARLEMIEWCFDQYALNKDPDARSLIDSWKKEWDWHYKDMFNLEKTYVTFCAKDEVPYLGDPDTLYDATLAILNNRFKEMKSWFERLEIIVEEFFNRRLWLEMERRVLRLPLAHPGRQSDSFYAIENRKLCVHKNQSGEFWSFSRPGQYWFTVNRGEILRDWDTDRKKANAWKVIDDEYSLSGRRNMFVNYDTIEGEKDEYADCKVKKTNWDEGSTKWNEATPASDEDQDNFQTPEQNRVIIGFVTFEEQRSYQGHIEARQGGESVAKQHHDQIWKWLDKLEQKRGTSNISRSFLHAAQRFPQRSHAPGSGTLRENGQPKITAILRRQPKADQTDIDDKRLNSRGHGECADKEPLRTSAAPRPSMEFFTRIPATVPIRPGAEISKHQIRLQTSEEDKSADAKDSRAVAAEVQIAEEVKAKNTEMQQRKDEQKQQHSTLDFTQQMDQKGSSMESQFLTTTQESRVTHPSTVVSASERRYKPPHQISASMANRLATRATEDASGPQQQLHRNVRAAEKSR